jgi:hypothetical protein
MRHSPYRKNTGSAWAAGFGILGLVVTTAVIVYLFWKDTSAVVGTGPGSGTMGAQDQAKKIVGQINMRNAGIDQTIQKEMSPSPSAAPMRPSPSPVAGPGQTPTTSPAASPSPVASAAPAAPGQAPGGSSGGSPSGGSIIGPISPVSPVAPIQEGSGPNLRPVKKSAGGVNDAVNDRNKELEKMLEDNK